MADVTLRGDLNRPLTNAEMDANFINLNEELATKEPAITAATTAATAKYWRGDKTWRDFFTDVRAATLTGLSTATNSVVAATDTVLAAIGKLQAQVSAKFDKTGGSVAGTINFTGPARRITGDFSDATVSKRLLFQTNVRNGDTTVGAVPNGSGGTSGFAAYAKADVANSEVLTAYATAISSVVAATKTGSGDFTPLLLLAGDLERLRIDPTTGNVGIGTSAPANKFVVSDAGEQGLEILPNTAGMTWISCFNRATSSSTPLALQSSALFFSTPSAHFAGVFGYGAGAGGTAVQPTSKSTTVPLNKPTGEITMNNASLAAGASVLFVVSCSVFAVEDAVYVQQVGSNSYRVEAYTASGGEFGIRVTNLTDIARAEALKVRFVILKGASA